MASSNRACGGNGCILHALRAGSKTLSLDNNHLRTLPEAIVRLKSLKAFSAKNNHLQDDISNILMNFSEVRSLLYIYIYIYIYYISFLTIVDIDQSWREPTDHTATILLNST